MTVRSEILPFLTMLFCGAMTFVVIQTGLVDRSFALFILAALTVLYVWEVLRDPAV